MIPSVRSRIQRDFQNHIQCVQEFLRIPSVGTDPTGLADAAIWLRTRITKLGGMVELEVGAPAPIIVGRFDRGRPLTLLVYGMYDVEDVVDQAWSSTPFGAGIVELPDVGRAIVARGACNSKGPLAALLNAVEAVEAVDRLPVNLVLLLEGEEEKGSPSLHQFVQRNRERLRATAGFEPFWAEYGTDVYAPVLSLGTKGVLILELVCRGGDWGGPTAHSVHSSVAAWLSSPVWRLLHSLATLVTPDGKSLVEGLTHDPILVSEEDRKLLENLGNNYDEKRALEVIGARRFKIDVHGAQLLEAYLFSPTIQVTQIAPLEAAVVPAEARATVLVRLVPGMDPSQAQGAIRAHLAREGYADIVLVKQAAYPGSRTRLGEKVVQAMLSTYRDFGREPQIWPFLASATPYYIFSEVLGIPYTAGGLGRAGRSHVADEYATLSGLQELEESIATFFYRYAAAD
jgi:acetylornithine deacetylase/succinyl-diaminopimelate desuccinylase-like protein